MWFVAGAVSGRPACAKKSQTQEEQEEETCGDGPLYASLVLCLAHGTKPLGGHRFISSDTRFFVLFLFLPFFRAPLVFVPSWGSSQSADNGGMDAILVLADLHLAGFKGEADKCSWTWYPNRCWRKAAAGLPSTL